MGEGGGSGPFLTFGLGGAGRGGPQYRESSLTDILDGPSGNDRFRSLTVKAPSAGDLVVAAVAVVQRAGKLGRAFTQEDAFVVTVRGQRFRASHVVHHFAVVLHALHQLAGVFFLAAREAELAPFP